MFETADELAARYRVKRDTILKWQREKRIPCIKGSSRPILFDPAAVHAALTHEAEGRTSGKDEVKHDR